MKSSIVCLAAAAVLVGIACNHEEVPPSTAVTTTGAGVVANREAIDRITATRCAREQNCNNIGSDKKYKDEASCSREVRQDMESSLRPGECPRGLKEEKLSNCIQEIRNEKCGNPLDAISRLATCRTGSLCID